jgi:hypothetical protein
MAGTAQSPATAQSAAQRSATSPCLRHLLPSVAKPPRVIAGQPTQNSLARKTAVGGKMGKIPKVAAMHRHEMDRTLQPQAENTI